MRHAVIRWPKKLDNKRVEELKGDTAMHKIISLISIILLASTSVFAASERQIKAVEKVSQEWRGTYKFSGATFRVMQSNLLIVADTHGLLHENDLDEGLRKALEEHQKNALQQIVNKDKQVLPYLLREYANNIANRHKDWSDLPREVKKAARKSVKMRGAALEAAIESIGLAAIPSLTDLHSRAVREKASLLSRPIKKMLDKIVSRSQLEQEKAQFQKLISDSEAKEKVDPGLESDVWSDDPFNESQKTPPAKQRQKGI